MPAHFRHAVLESVRVPEGLAGACGGCRDRHGEESEDLDMDDHCIEERVRTVVQRVLKVDREKITPAARFTADLGASSIQSVELMAGFEEEFDLTLDEDEALAVQTVGDAVAYLAECLRRDGRG